MDEIDIAKRGSNSRFTVVDPRGHNREAARQMGYQIVDLIVDHLSTLADQPVTRSGGPLPPAPPINGRPWPEVYALLRDVIVPGAMQVAHPRFFGHMDSGALYVSVLADFLAAALNQNMLAFELSPLATAMEREVVSWFCKLSGLPEGSGGTLVSGGTAANLTGLLLARERYPSRRYILVSDQAHYSIKKIAKVIGLGPEAIVSVPADEAFRIDPTALRQTLENLPEAPLAVVATAGTTSTGSVDPLAPVSSLCRQYGIWLHVDAVHAAGALFVPGLRTVMDGLEEADSIALDPHKWLMQPKNVGAILVRDTSQLQATFGTTAPYLARKALPTSQGQLTLQGSRRWDALRLWVAWQHLGEAGFGRIIQHSLDLTLYLASILKANAAFELAHEPQLNLLCFRLKGPDERTESAQGRLVKNGYGFVSLTTLRGKRWFRAVLMNPSITREDINSVVEALAR